MERDRYPRPIPHIWAIRQRDLSSASPEECERELAEFEERLRDWKSQMDQVQGGAPGAISIETPVFKGGWLMPCIESVLYQSSTCWTFSAHWDGGDALSRRILEVVDRLNHPKLGVYFGDNKGIAHTRRFLTERGRGDYILTLDDDDMLAPDAVEKFLACVRSRPWSGIVRAMREFIDEEGNPAGADTWFPFMPRQYQYGMVTDPYNHSQPGLISRSAYQKTGGWEGFAEFLSAGEDCDIFLKVEEVAPIELLPEVLYYYRLSSKRTSLVITNEAAFEMWRRLVDRTIARIGLPIRRATDRPPFTYERLPRPRPTVDMIDFVVTAERGNGDNLALNRTLQALNDSGVSRSALRIVDGGSAAGRNEAFRQTTRPVVCCLDSGVQVATTATLNTLLAIMHERGADIVGPRIVTKDGTIDCADPHFSAEKRPVRRGRGELDRGQYNQVVEVPWLASTALMIRREVINAVGGLDETYCDSLIANADFCLKARRRDFRCVYAGTAALVAQAQPDVCPPEADLEWFHGKWGDFPELFELTART